MGRRVRLARPSIAEDYSGQTELLVIRDGAEQCVMQRGADDTYWIAIPAGYGACRNLLILTANSQQMLREELEKTRWLSFEEMGVDECGMTLDQFTYHFLMDHKKTWTEQTWNRYWNAYVDLIGGYSYFKDLRIEDLWGETLEDWEAWMLEQIQFHTCEMRNGLTVMRHVTKALFEQNYYHYDLKRHLHSIPKTLMRTEMKKQIEDAKMCALFYANPNQQAADICGSMYYLTMRIGEAVAFRSEQICEASHTVRIDSQIQKCPGGRNHSYTEKAELRWIGTTKGRRPRQTCYSDGTNRVFLQKMKRNQKNQKRRNPLYRNDRGYMVTEDDGSPVAPGKVRKNVQGLTCGTVNPHALRAQSMTDMYWEQRRNSEYNTSDVWRNLRLIKGIAAGAGHMDIRTTCDYIRPSPIGQELIGESIERDLGELERRLHEGR